MLWLSSPFQNLLPPPLCFQLKSKQLNPGRTPHTRLILRATLAHKAAWSPSATQEWTVGAHSPHNGLFADQQPETLIPSLFALKEHSWRWSNRYNVSWNSRPTHPDYSSPPLSGIACISDFLKGEMLSPHNRDTSHP